MSKSKKSRAKAFTGQPSKPGPATLPEARSLAERLSTPKMSENLRALEALREHWEFVEKSTPYKDALAGERSPSPIPSTICIEEIVPEPVAHMPPTSKRPKPVLIMMIGLPLADNKGKGKKVDPPVDKVSDNDEPISWGTNDEGPQSLYDDIAAGLNQQLDTEHGDYHDSVAYDHIALQVSFLTIGFIGLLIIELQGQFQRGLGASSVDSPVCICSIVNTSLSAQCLKCERCDTCKNAMNRARSLTKRVLDGDIIEFIGDSGASATFTSNLDDFTEYAELDNGLEARTANKGVPLKIKGSGDEQRSSLCT